MSTNNENFRPKEQEQRASRRPAEIKAEQELGDLRIKVEENIDEQKSCLMLMDEANLLFQKIANDPKLPRVYLHFILQIFESALRKDSNAFSVKLRIISEGYAKLSPEAKKIASEYNIDKIANDPSENNFEKFAAIIKQKAEEERLQRARNKIGEAIDLPLKDITYLGDAEKGHQIIFDVDGIEVKAVVEGKKSDLGTDIFLTDLWIDGHEVCLTNLMFFRTRVRKSVVIAKAYKLFRETYAAALKRYPELNERKIFYESSDGTIFLGAISDKDVRLMKKLKIPFVKTLHGSNSTDFLFYSRNGIPYFKQTISNNSELRASQYDAGAFEIYDKNGEKILLYSEWLTKEHKEKSEASKNEYIDSYLSKKLDNDEMLNLFFDKILRYTHDDALMTSMSTFKHLDGSTTLKSSDDKDIFSKMHESWQTWQQTLDREENHAYLGDCDDYAFLAKKIFDAQKRGYSYVISIPQHATAIAVHQNEDGSYTLQDVGTFEFTKITAPTLCEAYEALLERYKKTGVGVWQGQNLKLNPFDITILDVQPGKTLSSSIKYSYGVSLESLVNPALLEAYLKVERLLFDYKSQEALQFIEQYRNQYPNEILFDKLAAIALFQLGRKDESIKYLVNYLKSNLYASQDDYRFLLKMIEEDEDRFLVVVEYMISVLPEINYDFYLSRNLRHLAIYSDKKEEVKELFLKMKPKISESSREDFWHDQLSTGYFELSEELGKQFLREYFEFVITGNGVPHIIEKVVKYSNCLPTDEQLTYALRLVDKYPLDPVCNELLLAVLERAKKTDLIKYLLENGHFDGKITRYTKTITLADIYFASGDTKKGLNIMSASLPKNKDEMAEPNVSSIYSFLVYEFKTRNPKRGEQFYLQHIQTSSPEFKCGPKEIIEGWVECKYKNVEQRTLTNVQADYLILSDAKYTNAHRFFYLVELIDQCETDKVKGKQFKQEDIAILNFIKEKLIDIRNYLASKYPDKDAVLEYSEIKDPADERSLIDNTGFSFIKGTLIDRAIEKIDKLLRK